MHLTYRWQATLVIALGLLMSILDVTIVSVVLPQIATAFHTALGIFTLGSALYAFAPNEPALIAFRIFQGIGGGALLPVGMAIDGNSVADGETACQSHHAGGIWRTLLVPTKATPPWLRGA